MIHGSRVRLGLVALLALVPLTAVLQRSTTASSQDPTEADARMVCATCHALPPPEILPRSAWRNSFIRMTLIREGMVEPELGPEALAKLVPLPADMARLLPWYERQAPERLAPPDPWPAASAAAFRRRELTFNDAPPYPAVSHVQLVDLSGDARPELLVTDMRNGLVLRANLSDAQPALKIAGRTPHPAHVTVADLDGNGTRDLLVADLGEFLPRDHEKGAVVWLEGRKDGSYAPHTLAKLPRAADVQAADFDGDGDQDLIVAAFGWRKQGRIVLLENRTTDWRKPNFVPHDVDPRPGAISVPPIDINRDGRMDFIALISQQFETVVAFVNTGRPFEFRQEIIYTAPHPNWGSSGIHVVDFDKDGDPDILLANGDMFDDTILKPYHGITLLENAGSFPFAARRLAPLAGVHRTIAADVDGDGDNDVVAVALVSATAGPVLPALVWLEQVKPGVFERRTLLEGTPRHAAVDAGDIDGDGDLDLVVGTFTFTTPTWTVAEVWEALLQREKGGARSAVAAIGQRHAQFVRSGRQRVDRNPPDVLKPPLP